MGAQNFTPREARDDDGTTGSLSKQQWPCPFLVFLVLLLYRVYVAVIISSFSM